MDTYRNELQLNLAGKLVKLARLYRREIDKRLTVFGVSDATAIPVMLIGRLGDGVRQVVLAEEMGVEGPSLVRLLDQLSHAGLIERHDDPVDRRAKTLHLTAAGTMLAHDVELALINIRKALFADVSDEDMAACIRVFDALGQTLQGHSASGTDAVK